MVEEKEGVEMTCHLCGYKWNYKGKSKYYVTCPQCYSKTKVKH